MFRKNKKNTDYTSPDSFTKVRTTAAKTETTNTTVHTATVVNENSRTISYQTTRQTVTHQQQAGITEIKTIHYSPDKEEIEHFLAELNLGNENLTTARLQQMLQSTKEKCPSFKTENTTVTKKSGSKMTCMVEEQHIKLNNANTTSFFNANFDRKSDFKSPHMQRAITSTSKVDAHPSKNQSLFNSKPISAEIKRNAEPSLRSTLSVPSINKNSYSKALRPPYTSLSTSQIVKKMPNSTHNEPIWNNPAVNRLKEIPNPRTITTSQKQFGAIAKTRQKSLLKPGLAFIFNNENFDDQKNISRVGTDADARALVETFKMFNLTVEVYKDATLSKVQSIVKSITNRDFKKHACLVIVILTHGSRNERVQARDKSYSIDDDVLFPIMKNPSLSEKPKIFFIQACKGFMEVEDFHKDTTEFQGTPAEVLKCYSTFEGYVSYRTEQGTFFIQKLCEELKKNGKTEDIEVIMKSVTAAVKKFTGGKQIPTMTVNLTEPFVFGDYA